MRYLTKSRFKLALECVTKLYYTGKPNEYADKMLDDPFLRELARGGFQVGELAKFRFCDNPVSEGITIEALDYDEALAETAKRLKKDGDIVIAEAAFTYNSLFIRTDIFQKTKTGFELYEVKAKSIDDEDSFVYKNGSGIIAEWEEYLYDVAFQKYVVTKSMSLKSTDVRAHLILVDKEKRATVDGLNQKFKIFDAGSGRLRVKTEDGLLSSKLGESILRVENVDEIVDKIWNEYKIPKSYEELVTFEEFVNLCAESYVKDLRIFTPVGGRCKDCQFTASVSENAKLKNGRIECWGNATKYDDATLRKDWAIELPASGASGIADKLVMKGKYLVEQVEEVDIRPKKPSTSPGLSWHDRRMEQIRRVKAGTLEPYINKEGLKREMEGWKYPLHMIDFETTRTAVPFHKGRRPYEGIAFQFSHHIIESDGSVRHAGQFLSFQPGVFPNYDFVRTLKTQLEVDEGTIFRYHIHENTFLKEIHEQLGDDPNPPADKQELQAFIQSVTVGGQRAMVDLYELARLYYYSPTAKGSVSLKHILPAIIHDSKLLRDKYGRPVYGRNNEIPGMNFENHVWIRSNKSNDPYKTLDPLFPDYDGDKLDVLIRDLEGIDEGGAAMTAYNILQFSELPSYQRERIKQCLLRYCELDTMAMVMLIEGWRDLMKSA